MGRVVGTLESTLGGPIEDLDPKCYKSEVIKENVPFFSDRIEVAGVPEKP